MVIPDKVVKVQWIDASWDSATLLLDEIDPLAKLVETGRLICEDKDSITVGLEACPKDDSFRHIVSIPRVGIQGMWVATQWRKYPHHWGNR